MSDEQDEEFVGTLQRFDVEILITHPTMTPGDISAELGMDAHFCQCVGETRTTPKGRIIGGKYPDTRWRHSIGYETSEQHFANEVKLLVDSLMPNKAFFARVRETGGTAEVIVQFLGDGYFGDAVPWKTLADMADLQLDFGIESFLVPQNDHRRDEKLLPPRKKARPRLT
ncbi:MAG: hypothetical protein AAF942_04935 [Pseudomonadota bacterium]